MKTGYSLAELMRLRHIEKAKQRPTTLFLFAVRDNQKNEIVDALVCTKATPCQKANQTLIPCARSSGRDYEQALSRLRAWVDGDWRLHWCRDKRGYLHAISPSIVPGMILLAK